MRYVEAENRVVWSASDLKAAAECEFAWLRAIDAKLGRVEPVDDPVDATLERAARLGTEHERRMLQRYRDRFGSAVVEISETRSSDADGLAAAIAQTIDALRDDSVEVVYQAAFATAEFVGFADFLVRDDARRWIVQDTKLARHARVTALMQLAAYADQLDRLGVPRSDEVQLLLGDGTTSTHALSDIRPVFELRRERLRALIADRDLAAGIAGDPIAWGDDRGELKVVACGRCPTCDLEVVSTRDLLLVAGMRPVQRERMRAAGLHTIDDLASAAEVPERMNADTFGLLQTQARLQLVSPAGVPVPAAMLVPAGAAGEPTVTGQPAVPAPPAVPSYEVVFPKALGALPRPDTGDMFFDFEGDPLYTEGDGKVWGIDYLFGWVDGVEQYSALWAHDFADEKAAFERFLDIVRLRREQFPGMHIYHYAPYETAHLTEMSRRYGVGEQQIDQLLRDGVFVDLYPVVKRALRVGSRSYSIKKLEPLYMGDEVRTSDVQRGDDSIVKYVEARTLQAAGVEGEAQAILDDLADYNRYDCVSTRRLRNWLVDRAIEAGLRPTRDVEPDIAVYESSPRAALLAKAAKAADDEAEADALELGSAAIDYYPREAKTFWASHYQRLREPVTTWQDTRDVVVIDAARSRVVEDWHQGVRSVRRLVMLQGELAPGTKLSEGGRPFALYELPAPYETLPMPRWIHAAHMVEVVEVHDDGVVIAETAVDGQTWDALPLALTPSAPPMAGNQQTAIEEWADAVVDALPRLPRDPATDILARRPPRLHSGSLDHESETISAIVAGLRNLDRSYLAVQGPPGTGKTYVGSHVIARLVREHHWRIGVVAQSHAVVEHMLDRVIDAGVPMELVGKATKDAEASFTVFPKNGLAAFTEERRGSGFVVGGTAWDFSHAGRVPRGSLDLLVIDEAGQFALAATIAVAVGAERLLLLGDPQQLPQVSQGTHPAPVDTSALGWVMDGHAVMPADRGFFLAQSWRMHPAVAGPVSQLSYAGELESHPSARLRVVAGLEPGVHPIPVRHDGNATQSAEEAERVVQLVRDLLGREWTDATDGDPLPPRALEASDLIVVTPYNAQQVLVEEALVAAGFGAVPVGTVDKFQGQEAAVAIVSLAASSGRDAPRGLEFLLLQNRLNVAVSRAKYAAYIVYSPGLLDDLPRTPDGVARLSGFAVLVGAVDRDAAIPAPAGLALSDLT
ncbi:MAG TPA: TM0106 family RecB-like putative nuclease [Microbacterium sp.]|uniref:TM0106 family RecB-like putative nuclease n=1 Tax=Microbacterium sp. TaxID=51671 RepID=UPI002B477C95|nr:TM0106 family RecB-like putative nuclease [Microbacterium sp.]HKT55818.1 TM0106 family RecB-like putative nuclease [Microbacterium sp.]